MPVRKVMIGGLLGLAALMLALAVPTLFYYERIDPESLRSQLIESGIVGSSPEQAAGILHRIELPRGSELSVGAYNATTKQLFGSVSNAQRRGWHIWRARITLSFREGGPGVEQILVELVSDRPL